MASAIQSKRLLGLSEPVLLLWLSVGLLGVLSEFGFLKDHSVENSLLAPLIVTLFNGMAS